jgi:hypothetical protein
MLFEPNRQSPTRRRAAPRQDLLASRPPLHHSPSSAPRAIPICPAAEKVGAPELTHQRLSLRVLAPSLAPNGLEVGADAANRPFRNCGLVLCRGEGSRTTR